MGGSLHVDGLQVTYPGPPPVRAVDGLTLTVEPGECLGILGESGSGKTTFGRALLGLHDEARIDGDLRLGDLDLAALDEDAWQDVRWRRIAIAFQSTSSLNPVLKVGEQVAEPMRVHLGMDGRAAAERAGELLDEIGPGAWAASRYPKELSGGQCRLVLLAMALACDPEVLVLDEPTAGLDPVTRNRVLRVLERVQQSSGNSMVILGHDVDTLESIATHVAVMYRGWLAELGPAHEVLARPRSPYASALLNARPTLASVKELRGIRGIPPLPGDVEVGCPFLGRCTQAIAGCAGSRPPWLVPVGEEDNRWVSCVRGGVVPVLTARGLTKSFRPRGLTSERMAAVDSVDLDVREGEVVGIVGPTGAGKSTLGHLLVRLLDPDSGSVVFEGHDVLAAGRVELKALHRRVQLLFQDPFQALSPRLTIGQIVGEPLDVQKLGTPAERDALVRSTLTAVHLPADDSFLDRWTHQLSGGQLQRVALARALVLDPKLLVADEPVSMLDPSEQANMLQLLKQLQVDRGMAMVFVSHDLATVLRIADRVIVLDRGRIVEEGPGSRLLVAPQSPVTQALLSAAGRDVLFAALLQVQPAVPSLPEAHAELAS